MPTIADFKLASCQASLFTPDAEVSVTALLTRLLPGWSTRFDGDPVALPTVQGLPKEVPRVILQSRSLEWRCEVAPARINVFWQRKGEGDPIEVAEFYRQVIPLLQQYHEFLNSRVGRLAAVIIRYSSEAAPARFLASHFCKDRWLNAPFNMPSNFELHAHKKFLLAERFEVNSWVRNKTGMLTHPGREGPVILVEQDMNTLAEEADARQFSNDEIAAFFDRAVPGFDETLNLYYPPNGGA